LFRHETLGDSEVVVRIRSGSKDVVFDGSPVRRLGDVIGRFPTILFSSEDIQLVRGAPSMRRRFLDLFLAGSEPGYLQALQTYFGALENRNRLLKETGGAAETVAFEKLMAPAACSLIDWRRRSVEKLGRLAGEFHRQLSDGGEEGTVGYRTNVEVGNEAEYLALLEKHRVRDAQMRSTQHGPHRDDLDLRIGGREALNFASEGQQRALVLAMRFAQLRDVRARTGIGPVVLADDVLGELDPDRRRRFWAAMDADLQLFATGTSLPADISSKPESPVVPWQIFGVESGCFTGTSRSCD
jgi:DNA replication and repair protein RecF